MRPEAFLFVEPHAGYDPAEAASETAAPSLSRFELAWERLLRRRYLLRVITGSLSSAANAHANKKSLSRFLRPGGNKDTTGPDGASVRAQSGFDDLVRDFNEALRADLPSFVLAGDAGIDRYWTTGVAVATERITRVRMYSTGSPGYSSDSDDVADDPQFTMPAVAFKTLGEAWPRVAPKTTALPVSEGIGPDGDPVVSERTYTVPRWHTSLPEGDLDRVSTVDVDGVRTYWTAKVGYGVNDLLDVPYRPYARREHLGYDHAYLADIPARAPTREPVGAGGNASVWPVPSVAVSRYAEEGWEADDLALMPARLRPAVEACFVPPALVPCLRAEFPPPDGWRCGMASEHGGVPYGEASAVVHALRMLYRATAGSMDAWLSRMSRTATGFPRILWDFGAKVASRWRWTREHHYDSGQSYRYDDYGDDWLDAEAEAYGSYAASPSDRCELQPGRSGATVLGGFGWGVLLYAPAATGRAEDSYASRVTYSYSDELTEKSWTSVETYDDRGVCSWNASLDLRNGVPVWTAPWSYAWRRETSRKGSDPYGDSGTESGTAAMSRVIPPEFMPFVKRAEVFAYVRAESESRTTYPGMDGVYRTGSRRSSAGLDESSSYESRSEDLKRAEERRLVSLGVLDESGALPPASLAGLLALAPAAGLSGAGAPSDGEEYGSETRVRRTVDAHTGWSDYSYSDEEYSDFSYGRSGKAGVRCLGSSFILVVDWDFDAEHDPFADSELNALWRELAEAGRERAAAAAARDAADAALAEARAALSAAGEALASLEAELASLDDAGESARRLAALEAARDAEESAVADAELARAAAEAARDDALRALEEAESAEEPDEAEVERLRDAYRDAFAAMMDAERAEESARARLAAAETALKRYRDLVEDAEGARDALEAEVESARAAAADAEAAVPDAEAAAQAAAAAYGAADDAYRAILARIRRGAT